MRSWGLLGFSGILLGMAYVLGWDILNAFPASLELLAFGD